MSILIVARRLIQCNAKEKIKASSLYQKPQQQNVNSARPQKWKILRGGLRTARTSYLDS
ncbi:MAG: hypothetical protein ABI299_12090 [Rhodanobacter sp.]